jgi:hypothetical protein
VSDAVQTHEPTLVGLGDGRWVVRCVHCQVARAAGHAPPIGIGLAMKSRFEAESILRNHADDPTFRRQFGKKRHAAAPPPDTAVALAGALAKVAEQA